MPDTSVPKIRSVRFGQEEPFEVNWHPLRPEFAHAANAVSLMMPHVEPYVVRSVNAVIGSLPAEVQPRARAYVAQESRHQAQHRRFNQHILRRYPTLRYTDAALAWVYRRLAARRSTDFHLAYAAGAETIAYAIARWVADHHRELLSGVQGPAADLFIWHLAEEVEHKSVAFDVMAAQGVSRRAYFTGMITSLLLLAWFTVMGTTTMLVASGRVINPLAWLRLIRWGVSFAFELLPMMGGALLAGHHPDGLADPAFYDVWLQAFDARGGAITVPAVLTAEQTGSDR